MGLSRTKDECSKRGFTLVELAVCFGVILAIMSLVAPLLKKARDRAIEAQCISSIRDISIAVQLYYNDHTTYPAQEYLRNSLTKYHGGETASWHCPESGEPYELFYVARGIGEECDSDRETIDNYFLGCPDHGLTNFSPGKGTRSFPAELIRHNGQNVSAGDSVRDGLLEFADGSTAALSGKVKVLGSFRMDGGRLYTILRVFRNYGNTSVTVTVPTHAGPRSKFEVVTPAAIAGVVGTTFNVEHRNTANKDETRFRVVTGSIYVTGPYCQPFKVDPSMGTAKVKVKKMKCQKEPPWRPTRNNPGGGSSAHT